MVSPRWMGLAEVAKRLFFARTTVGIAVSGPATPLRNTLGAVGRMVKLRSLLVPPGVWSVMVALPSTSNGICALIWRGEANSIGAGVPFTVRQESPSAVGTGSSLVAIFTGLNWLPHTVTRPPGATGRVSSAALTTA